MEKPLNTDTPFFETQTPNEDYPEIMNIEPEELNLKRKDVCLIDVRSHDEFRGELGHIPNSKNIALQTLESRINEIPKDQHVVFICKAGPRSTRAAAFAKTRGYKNVYNLTGGMLLWNDLEYETEK